MKNLSIDDKAQSWLSIIIVVLAFFIIVIGILSSVEVGAGQRGVLMEFGRVTGTTLDPGLHFIIPFYNSVALMNVQTQVYHSEATAASKDLQDTNTSVALNYHVNPDNVTSLYQDIGIDYESKVIVPVIQEVIKASTAKYNAEELITLRPQVRDSIQEGLVSKLSQRGIIVEQVSITDFKFSEQFSQAIEQKVTAEQLALKAENDLQRIKIEAEQKVAQAEGEAKSIDVINTELLKSPQYVNYMIANKWDGHLPTVTGSGGLPLITLPGGTTSK
jgi:prohibitin 2